jgi:hypothetical protein
LIQYQNSYEGLTELESIINQPARPFSEEIAYRWESNIILWESNIILWKNNIIL